MSELNVVGLKIKDVLASAIKSGTKIDEPIILIMGNCVCVFSEGTEDRQQVTTMHPLDIISAVYGQAFEDWLFARAARRN